MGVEVRGVCPGLTLLGEHRTAEGGKKIGQQSLVYSLVFSSAEEPAASVRVSSTVRRTVVRIFVQDGRFERRGAAGTE